MAMDVAVLTLFPEMFAGPLSSSILGRARDRGLLRVALWNIRDFASDKHRIVDDSPYGGGAGMVMKADVVGRCIDSVRRDDPGPLIYLSPQGKPFTQEDAASLAQRGRFTLLCGHYEGVDERVRQLYVDAEISLGDFVLTGGELAAMAVIDAAARFVPGVLGREDSVAADSFSDGLLEHPHFTRPPVFAGLEVPAVLRSGDHARIRRWRLKESLRRTKSRRPDLLARVEKDQEIAALLRELEQE